MAVGIVGVVVGIVGAAVDIVGVAVFLNLEVMDVVAAGVGVA